ncbi:MdtA/MuxA family multidrug efflux RND transporter periplasmic adaptor subunit [Acerihabitans sp. TG2]|uniref:MdtA/MuxA family multidrug efflux RND transporter periplasmic adaptor subunit n=1 Tax=Acerihabitans sp. TG2 TaxID=3096008 RepID=UPI002B2234D8|nr:MdtA/MuxA family multidrug efflux RND transporter periplasmic adaptor subunit [Acerihabitans sp. TG2]MEA9388976.1 MdtA/MuxA family multidrug efflux RND transporter periplasmic adaptor subunit [Acerihabitans sp. TG2]
MKGKSVGRKWLLILASLAIVIGAVLLWRQFHAPSTDDITAQGSRKGNNTVRSGDGRANRRSSTLSPVQAATAQEKSVPRYLTGLGTVTAAATVTVRSRVDGQLMALHFTEGQWVKTGALLAEIDPRPFEVSLQQAKGQLAKDRATLANARQDLTRYQQLIKTNLIARQQLDTQQATVRESEGQIEVDQGALASAELQLTYSKIIAPIDGRVGLRQVDVGNYISSSDTNGLVVITQTRPIDVLFTLPENDIASVITSQKNGVAPLIEVWDRTNKQKITEGKLLSMDNQIDATTGTVKLKGRFDNSDDSLFPNQFVNIRMKVDTLQNAVVIPAAALQMNNDGHFVWVLNDENRVSQHRVTAGLDDNQQVVITAGLAAGQRVVTDGIDRLTEGVKVEVVTPAVNQPTLGAKPRRDGNKS